MPPKKRIKHEPSEKNEFIKNNNIERISKHDPSAAISNRARRACDACKTRKIKCDGAQKCNQCESLKLICSYTPRESKPRRRIKRGTIIALYKNDLKNHPNGVDNNQVSPNGSSAPDDNNDHHIIIGHSPSSVNNLGLSPSSPSSPYMSDFFENIIDDYSQSIYPMFPVIRVEELREVIASEGHYINNGVTDLSSTSRMNLSFLHAMAAVTVGHTGSKMPSDVERKKHVKQLIQLSLEFRGAFLPHTTINIRNIMTSVWISSALVGTHDVEIAWIYLREAISMAAILRLDDVDAMKKQFKKDLPERARRQRLYWMLFMHERFMAIHYYRQVILSPLSIMPEQDELITDSIHHGYLQLIKLFSLVDMNFINAYLSKSYTTNSSANETDLNDDDNEQQQQPQQLINHSQDSGDITQTSQINHIGHTSPNNNHNNDKNTLSRHWVEQKQNEIKLLSNGFDNLTEMQQVDLIISQQWLRMLVWQMAMSHYLLDSADISKGSMSLLFPVEIASRLRTLISSCSPRSIEVHGCSIVEKLFELTVTIADVVAYVPVDQENLSYSRIDDFRWISDFLLKQPSVSTSQKDLLEKKLANVNIITANLQQNRNADLQNDNSLIAYDQDNPWLSISKSFVREPSLETTTADGSNGAGDFYSVETSFFPMFPRLDRISEASQDILNDLQLSHYRPI